MKTTIYALVALVLSGSLLTGNLFGDSPVDWVDPLIDTHESRWFYFNSASRPFGMVNLSPDTQTKGSWKSGYLYGDSNIRCFSHIHAWQLSGIPVMPITGEMTGHHGMDVYQSEFSHDDELVAAGYHKVVIEEIRDHCRADLHRPEPDFIAIPTRRQKTPIFCSTWGLCWLTVRRSKLKSAR